MKAAFVHPAAAGRGGLGRLAVDVLTALDGSGVEVLGLGPAPVLPAATWPRARFAAGAPAIASWKPKYTPLRWLTGRLILGNARAVGRWAAEELAHAPGMDLVWAFNEVGLEPLQRARDAGVPTVLDNATADVRHYREACVREQRRWVDGPYLGHPSRGMVERSVHEYDLATRVRVASHFSRRTMIERGVPPERVTVVPYPIDVQRFAPPAQPRDATGALRLAYVAAISFAKGFQYLLSAAHRAGPRDFQLRLVGGTDSRYSRRVYEQLARGLSVVHGPADDLTGELQAAELLVHPSLHDGWAFVVPEAMACGLPAIVSDASGAAELVEHGVTGWIVPAGDETALARTLREAHDRRDELPAMGARARAAMERAAQERAGALAAFVTAVLDGMSEPSRALAR